MDENLQVFPYEDAMAALTAIVTAYVSRTEVHPDLLPPLIARIKAVLVAGLDQNSQKHAAGISSAEGLQRRWEETIQPDYLVCLENGKRFKSLKRHLRSKYDMSPDDYRRKWNLPADYPMVAPGYAKKRSKIAREFGLGTTICKNNRRI